MGEMFVAGTSYQGR